MSSERTATAVSCWGLGKLYRLGQQSGSYGRLTESLSNFARAPLRRRRPLTPPDLLWALRDVSFDVTEGEVVGVVGRNGAGKTTLLKLLSRITEPTTGRAVLGGRVAALLEVGTGFHPELSGRENIFLNGAILGMRKKEIERKFDEIVEFAEIERFIDTPVKRYSSGMYVRLAFAVAAHLEPEILIVDEVLAVGDGAFQRKCLGKMDDVARSGRTVLFVSHNMQAVKFLCTRAIHLAHGELVRDGDADSVVDAYLAETADSESERVWEPGEGPGDEHARLIALRIIADGATADHASSSRPIVVELELDVGTVHSALKAGFDLTTSDGTLVMRSFHSDAAEEERATIVPGRNVLRCTIPAELLNGGRFTVTPRVTLHFLKWIVNDDRYGVHFDVLFDHGRSPFFTAGQHPGPISPMLPWTSSVDAGLLDAANRSSP
jgi:lipopolysaccharide transport system ATP-binding protein